MSRAGKVRQNSYKPLVFTIFTQPVLGAGECRRPACDPVRMKAPQAIVQRAGRTQGLIAGAGTGIVAALICALAIGLHNFWLLCLGTLIFGASNATGQYYRFAAADVSPADYKARAISLVLAGGLVGGILGPGLSRY